MFPMGENIKDLKKHCGKSVFLKLSSDQPFDTWKAQVLVKIDATFHPNTIVFDDYEVLFSAPCVPPTPLAITDEEGYVKLIQHAIKSKNYKANIYIQQMMPTVKKHPHSSSNTSGSEGNLSKDKKMKKQKKMPTKKSHSLKAADIDESNQPVDKNVKLLCACSRHTSHSCFLTWNAGLLLWFEHYYSI
ncbi:hypothetical protein J3A83DRAFT_4186340 [Scleroderma citrinum]